MLLKVRHGEGRGGQCRGGTRPLLLLLPMSETSPKPRALLQEEAADNHGCS